MDTLTITKSQLEAALLRWGQGARAGKTRSREETGALPVEQVAAESAAHLGAELCDRIDTICGENAARA